MVRGVDRLYAGQDFRVCCSVEPLMSSQLCAGPGGTVVSADQLITQITLIRAHPCVCVHKRFCRQQLPQAGGWCGIKEEEERRWHRKSSVCSLATTMGAVFPNGLPLP